MATTEDQDGDGQRPRWRQLKTKMATVEDQDGDGQRPRW